jgi:hypothetical protein
MTEYLRILIPGLILAQSILGLPAYAQEERPQTGPPQSSGYEENLRRWQNMPESGREALRQKVRSMSPEEKNLVRANAEKFSQLPAEEKDRLQNNFREFKKLPDKTKQVLREKSAHFQQLPPEKKDVLRREAGGKSDRGNSPEKDRKKAKNHRVDKSSPDGGSPSGRPVPHGRRAKNDGVNPPPEPGSGQNPGMIPPKPRAEANDHPKVGSKKESRSSGGGHRDKKPGRNARKNR